jgi:hypothetical protein
MRVLPGMLKRCSKKEILGRIGPAINRSRAPRPDQEKLFADIYAAIGR